MPHFESKLYLEMYCNLHILRSVFVYFLVGFYKLLFYLQLTLNFKLHAIISYQLAIKSKEKENVFLLESIKCNGFMKELH